MLIILVTGVNNTSNINVSQGNNCTLNVSQGITSNVSQCNHVNSPILIPKLFLLYDFIMIDNIIAI